MEDKLIKLVENFIEKYDEDFPWYVLEGERHKVFEKQLHKEVISLHGLYDKKESLRAVVKSECNDDVIFVDDEYCYVVHLTWAKGNEIYPRYQVMTIDNIPDFFEKSYQEYL